MIKHIELYHDAKMTSEILKGWLIFDRVACF